MVNPKEQQTGLWVHCSTKVRILIGRYASSSAIRCITLQPFRGIAIPRVLNTHGCFLRNSRCFLYFPELTCAGRPLKIILKRSCVILQKRIYKSSLYIMKNVPKNVNQEHLLFSRTKKELFFALLIFVLFPLVQCNTHYL